MKAWQVHGVGEPADVMRMVERQLSDPGPGQVKIEVSAAGIGLPDVLMCRGTYPLTPPARSHQARNWQAPLPRSVQVSTCPSARESWVSATS